MGELYLGTSGYTYKDWRGIFYPKGLAQKDWLPFYARHYNTVEINATFYRAFPRSVYDRWREITPAAFRFTLKGPRRITHEKQLTDIEADLRQFVDSAAGLQDKLAVMLWQFPPQARAADLWERLTQFLPLLPTSIRQVLEFRHTSWFNDNLYALLNEHRAGFVINDSSRFPAREVITGNIMYVRFHGPGKLYASLYSLDELKTWAEKIKPRLSEHDVYLYFNNDYDGRALRNANELRDLLAG
ncbi:MAG: DUF72 domain-containing protein [Chloroflexi bacterium]|nr:DUF72 domain-containing protein [Chloroflexota bacterium]